MTLSPGRTWEPLQIQHFINGKMDMEHGEGLLFARAYGSVVFALLCPSLTRRYLPWAPIA